MALFARFFFISGYKKKKTVTKREKPVLLTVPHMMNYEYSAAVPAQDECRRVRGLLREAESRCRGLQDQVEESRARERRSADEAEDARRRAAAEAGERAGRE